METEDCKRAKTTPSESSIDNFSDEILTHILSFLPFKVAFRTTILSKRWLPLCHTLSVLTITDVGVKNTDNWNLFRRLVDSVMFSPHSNHLPLKSFRLFCISMCWNAKSDCFTLNNWLQEAKRRRVKEINLLFLSGIPLFPTVFTCKTLVILKLKSIRVTTMFDCSVDLPLLKLLNLYFVRFECMEDFMKLLYGCPILEILNTSCVNTTALHFTNERYLYPMCKMMKAVLHILDAGLVNGLVNDIEDFIKFVSGCSMFEGLIRKYDYSSVRDIAGGYTKPLSKLIKADIQLFDVPLKAVSGVQFLTLTGMGQSLGNEEINTYYTGFSVFENLIELRLFWLDHCIHDWDDVVTMLQNSPKLQTLYISKCRNSTTKQDWKYEGHVPKCVSSHLTTCRIIDYEPVEADFQFATYMLQNARLLQVMEIHCPFTPKAMASPKFIDDLISCPRISPECKLSLSCHWNEYLTPNELF